jgi:hypothetical protein
VANGTNRSKMKKIVHPVGLLYKYIYFSFVVFVAVTVVGFFSSIEACLEI